MPVPLLTALHTAADDVRPVVTIGDRSLHRDALLGAAGALAHRIAGSRCVAIDARAELDTVIAVLACLLVGVPAVPVPPDAGVDERRHILADSGAELWLGPSHPEVRVPAIPIDPQAFSLWTGPEPAPSSPALIVYTSGTTGVPKGVVLSRRAIAASLDGLRAAWDWTPDDVLVHGLPLFHVHGLVLGVLGALRVGSPLVHTVRPKPERYAAAAGSLYFGVPTVWSRVCADPGSARALSGARLLVSGSAPLPVPVFDNLATLTGHRPIERYGMTETVITLSTRFDGARRPGWVGLPLACVRARIRSESGDPVPHDGETLGRLEIAGDTLFDGYLRDDAETAEVMTHDGWFGTGDIAVVDAEGMHRIVGRESVDMIKSGGYRIGAGEVEHALLTHPTIREAAVIGVPDDDLGQRIVAYVVGEVREEQAIIDFIAATLSIHKRPREIRVVDELPRNAMGKVQKKWLLADASRS
ncbi:acyl-CoA synthetase [Nocardia panacis]|uniref:Acyl-CoA synthetase n=1 Tax=Nocardia panacis TaxID=2340916 RepID=A0A3A4JUT0_9NOCA|nr:acyl-CoA synthetase [Nocardia panacis]RJO73846.1 acyl-CoA synthetase [Nocardia panacis]